MDDGGTELGVSERNHGAFDSILKPLDQEGLFALIDRVVEHKFMEKRCLSIRRSQEDVPVREYHRKDTPDA